MGVKLTDLLNEEGTVKVHIGGSTVTLTYHSLWDARISDADWARYRATGDQAMPARAYYIEMLQKMLVGWDLVDAADQPIPITAEAINANEMPNRLLRAMFETVTDSSVVGKENGSS